MTRKNWFLRNWKGLLSAIVAGAGIGALAAFEHDQGYDEGTRYGAECVRDAGRRMYNDFDEKMVEYVKLPEDDEE